MSQSHSSASTSNFLLNDSTDFILYKNIDKETLLDTSGKLAIDQVLKIPFSKVKGDDFSRIKIGETRWFKVSLVNNSEKLWFIEFPDAHISEIKLYGYSSENVLIDSSKSGYHFPATIKYIQHKNHLFPFFIPKGQKPITFYIKIKSNHASFIQFQLRSLPSYWNYALNEYHYLGLFYGFLLFVFLINIFLYISTKDILYLGQTAFVIGCTLYSMGEDAIGAHVWWPNSTLTNEFFFRYGFLLWCTGFWLFSECLFKNWRANGRHFMVGLAIYTLIAISCIFQLNIHLELSLVLILLMLGQSVWKHNKGQRYLHFFTFGFAVVFCGQLVFFLRVYGFIETNIFTYYFNYLGFMAYNLIFTIVMSLKITLMRRTKELAHTKIIGQYRLNLDLREKVNKELEIKVKERTNSLNLKNRELEEVNLKLEVLSAKMLKMSEQIDKENWNLKKEIKQTKKTKIEKAEFTYQDFREIYPNKNVCLELLDELKWGKGFVCPKCQHQQFGKIEAPFHRICKSCGYSEKAKDRTILQSVKFDLTQALFIIYHVVESKKTLTVDELSEMINLRRNTCWAFRKKVKDALKITKALHWKSLIIND